MNKSEKLFQVSHPMAKAHGEIEKRLYENDKRQFGGMFYTDKARKLHIAVMGNNSRMIEQLAQKDVLFQEVKYSWETMNEVQEAVNSLLGRYGIHMSAFEPQNNRVCIGVDVANSEIVRAITVEMAGLGFASSDMFQIIEKARANEFHTLGESVKNESSASKRLAESSIDENTEPDEDDVTTIMPGGMILVEDSSGSLVHLCSVNYGYIYNNTPYLVGAGHAGSAAYVGQDAYYVPPITGYPISNVSTSYNSSKRVKVGVVALQRLGGNYDLRTIRVTENNLAFTHTAYNGWTITNIGGSITQGAPLRLCGITSRYDADYEYGYCLNSQVSMTAYGKTMTNLIQLDFGQTTEPAGDLLLRRIQAEISVWLVLHQ